MKIATLAFASAVALAGGSALAADNAGTHNGSVVEKTKDTASDLGHKTADTARKVGRTAGNMAHRGADATRNVGDRIASKLPQTQRNGQAASEDPSRDTAAMGASRDTGKMRGKHARADRSKDTMRNDDTARSNTTREQRMDDAYADWQKNGGTASR